MPKRIQMTRQKPWRAENPDAVIVARPSKWGNQAAKIGDDISYYTAGCTRATAVDVVELFSRFMEAHRSADQDRFELFIAPLRGKDLACWCPLDQPCHADILLELANATQ